ncbi:galactoside 2-alpha-L-fucosyltransferase 2-like [Zootermopsis nevadensis]|uniref:L-Fucosyltransferase n=1 Tax=Zootermopsis nevadensis TaxID=136037 RepID=A0A067QZM8_ZOONE|nr:galactoside 2-alpha-L-fucosyltransferase 2-like [Zootermopsis nevadensis]XP_021928445.1 galactoside 2-alpha-L-fucosyltransferase 2-like [Zootermopsis nevadensis]XP_021928446.1 galactoside 2-alpha-L-fucosyltransferase 2-like [Zootermopsis nevadensis]KDR14981.1 Galactoside 2-alpha-L-fucosyltransferase 2 [Zootermopsis nevadensis]
MSMHNRLVCVTINKKCILLTLLTVTLLMVKIWIEVSGKPETIIHKSKYTLHYEYSLCSSKKKPIEGTSHCNVQCPQKPIVTVKQLGRLGNQMWEYISVWAVAKKTGHAPYVPSCLKQKLEKVFQNLTVPALSCIVNCPVEKHLVEVKGDNLKLFNGNILLQNYVQLPEYIVPLLSEVRQIFQFKKHIEEESQRFLYKASKGEKNVTYVGVHVRRTDYKAYLKRKYNASLVEPDFFPRQMNYFRNNYKAVVFVVVSDEPRWCERELVGDNVVVSRANSPEQDLAIMAACNHSIIDYGTYGVWGAILAGGDTFVYNLTLSGAVKMASLLPNWHVVT